MIIFKSEPKKVGADVHGRPPPHSTHTYFWLLKIKLCFKSLVILLTWSRTGSGSGLIKFCGSGYNQSGSTSLVDTMIVKERVKKKLYCWLWDDVRGSLFYFFPLGTVTDNNQPLMSSCNAKNGFIGWVILGQICKLFMFIFKCIYNVVLVLYCSSNLGTICCGFCKFL